VDSALRLQRPIQCPASNAPRSRCRPCRRSPRPRHPFASVLRNRRTPGPVNPRE
jgi:hypothetical protein